METQKQLTPMQDLLIDLKNTKIKAKDLLNEIENNVIKEQVNKITEVILDAVINRIRNELLQAEKDIIIEAFKKGDRSDCITDQDTILFANEYYNNHYFTGAIPNKPKTKIKEIEMPIRLLQSLYHFNIVYLEDITENYTENDFMVIRGFGKKQMFDLKKILEKHNLKFKKHIILN